MGLILFIIIYIIASCYDSAQWSKSRSHARAKGYSMYYGKGGLRNVSDNSFVDYNELDRKLELSMYKNNYERGCTYVKDFKQDYPTLQHYINAQDAKKRI